MQLIRDALQVALQHDLLGGPALGQAVALLRRGAALGPARYSRLAE